jgi:hypothetical protein
MVAAIITLCNKMESTVKDDQQRPPTFRLSRSNLSSTKALAKLAEVRNLVTFPTRSTAMPEHANSCPAQDHIVSTKVSKMLYTFIFWDLSRKYSNTY